MVKSQTEKKVLKHLSKVEALEAELQLIFPPRVFEAIVELAKAYLLESKYSPSSRDAVSKVSFLLRQETHARFGHESLETIQLAKLLKPQSLLWKPPPPRMDSITRMREYPKNSRLDSEQESAAEQIKKVWDAFGRFRFIGARNMEGGGGGGGQPSQPLDVMGEEMWEHYKKYYKPWYKKAAMICINRRRYAIGGLSLAAICFRVLVEDYFPEEVDSGYGLTKGSCYRGLGVALAGYYQPEILDAFAEAQRTGKDGRSPAPVPKSA